MYPGGVTEAELWSVMYFSIEGTEATPYQVVSDVGLDG